MFYPCFHPWPMTSTSLASPPLFFQSFCFLVKFGGIGSLAPLSVQTNPHPTCVLAFLFLSIYAFLQIISKFWAFHLAPLPLPFLFFKRPWMKIFTTQFPKIGDVHVAFGILFQSFAQRPSYFLHFPSILEVLTPIGLFLLNLQIGFWEVSKFMFFVMFGGSLSL